ncbi:hypothetical protein, partial [Streptomyces sp. NRRL F-4489]|uniref:hypothetical protein n=1 Tax=Streptomyces sp. NRRL F-4489 TaxID=1609095 RepID=UPI001F15849F
LTRSVSVSGPLLERGPAVPLSLSGLSDFIRSSFVPNRVAVGVNSVLDYPSEGFCLSAFSDFIRRCSIQ